MERIIPETVAGLWASRSSLRRPRLPVGPPTDWGELVQAPEDRDAFQASPDDLPLIDILASDPCRTRGHNKNKAASRRDFERLRADTKKTLHQRGRQAFRAPPVEARERGRAAHELRTSRKTLEEVPLTGLSFVLRPAPL